jgi:hypothetical protein
VDPIHRTTSRLLSLGADRGCAGGPGPRGCLAAPRLQEAAALTRAELRYRCGLCLRQRGLGRQLIVQYTLDVRHEQIGE